MRSLLASKSRRGIGGDNGMGGGGIPALPALSSQTLAALYDGSLPAGQTYARLSNAWNPETGLLAPANMFLNSAVGVTQNITASATPTTGQLSLLPTHLSFKGTGSITISGTGSGTLAGTGATDRVELSFTPTAGTVTFTVTGTVTEVNVHRGAFQIWVPTTTAAVYAPRYLQGKQNQGILVESASTNKCTAFSVPRVDSLGAELVTGSLTAGTGITVTGNDATHLVTFSGAGMRYQSDTTSPVLTATLTPVALSPGKYYTITTTTTAPGLKDDGAFGGVSIPSGTSTTTLLCTGGGSGKFSVIRTGANVDVTVSAASVKEAIDYVGTKAYHNGAFQNPIPSMALSGDTAAVLSIVNDQAAIDAAIALNPTDGSMVALMAAKANGYKVYKLDNSAGSTSATLLFGGQVANTNVHSYLLFYRGTLTGNNRFYLVGDATPTYLTSNDVYGPFTDSSTPDLSTRVLGLVTVAGQTIYFLAPQLEESPYATSPILCNGVATTRASSTPSSPTAGVVGGTGMEKSGSLTTGTGFAVTGNDATHTITFGASGARYLSDTTTPTLALVSSNILTVGKTYRVQINTTVTSGNIKIDGFSGVSISPAAGLNIYDVIATSAGVTTYRTAANTDVLITEFSIKEVNILPATIQGWWKPEGVAAGKVQTLWSTYTGAADYTRIVYSGTQLIFTKAKTAQTTETITYTVTLTANTWNHFAITLAADGTALMYLNGVAVGTNGTTTAFAPVIAATMQPGAFNSTLQADSVLENYRYFDRVLTATEIVTYVARGK